MAVSFTVRFFIRIVIYAVLLITYNRACCEHIEYSIFVEILVFTFC